uniref:AT-hook motif nuclear-localized protein n=1 Tax=Oryza rufipogon TaxID=4529 RepID=A0A0E0R2S8_ORYRU
MEAKDVSPLVTVPPAPAAAAPPPAAAPAPPPSQPPPPPLPFAQQAPPPAANPAAAPMRLSFDQMAGKAPGGEQHHHHHPGPMLYAAAPAGGAAPPPQGGNVMGMGELMRKKRGRPRKYAPDGSMALALAPISSASGGAAPPPPPPGHQPHGFSISSPASDPNAKRRGRPPGSGKKKQFEALGSWGIAFTPHILTVKAGEPAIAESAAAVQQVVMDLCLLFLRSGFGARTNSTPLHSSHDHDHHWLGWKGTNQGCETRTSCGVRQIPSMALTGPGPTVSGTDSGRCTYVVVDYVYGMAIGEKDQGRFEIISLSGSFLLAEDGDTRSRTGGLSVALAGSDGRVLGGCVAGMLMAATPVQVVVASFIAEGKKSKPVETRKVEPMSAPPQMATYVPAPVASPPSEGTSSGSSDDSGSPINHSGMPYNHSGQQQQHQQHQHMPPAYASGGWSLSAHHQNRHDSDMKMMSN